MRIAIDAMGADNAPMPEIQGALLAGASRDIEIILVGHGPQLEAALSRRRRRGPNISVVNATQVITMSDNPLIAVRKKKDASMLVAMRLVKQGVADAVVSAGNTGAVMLAARTILRQVPGVTRSPLCQEFPTATGSCLVLDLGANVDCAARHLCDFAEMGVVYAQEVLGRETPRVGLLNIGEEQPKGNELAKTVHRTLSAAAHVNFIGNIEPKALYAGSADVLVCDGFVGNVFLKSSEAAGGFVKNLLAREIRSSVFSKVGAALCAGAFKRMKRTVDPNEYGGAILLGVNGVVIICHGASTGKGIANAVRAACSAVRHEINKHIQRGIEEIRSTEAQFEVVEEAVPDPASLI